MHCLLILSLICSYMWNLTSKTHIWCISGFVLKIGYYRGPVQGRWCYPIERCFKFLWRKCRNKAKIEASMSEAYITEEASNFTTSYYNENLPSMHNPLPRYNANENECNLTLFRGQLGNLSEGTPKRLTSQEWHTIMLYVLTNLDEVHPYMQ
jgi:hypothetical protein